MEEEEEELQRDLSTFLPTSSPLSTSGHHEVWQFISLPNGFLCVCLCSSSTLGAQSKVQGLCLLFTLSPKYQPHTYLLEDQYR